jgi:hypothetical protein
LAEQIKRPFGVTIIAILTIIGGILLTFGGISLLAFGAFFISVPIDVFILEQMQQQQKEQLQLQQQQEQDLPNAAEFQALALFLGGVGIVIGAIVLAVGIGYLVVSYGLLKGKGWAWIITVIIQYNYPIQLLQSQSK